MKDNVWQLQEAKSKFSRLVDEAMHKKPQIVTRHGDKAVVVLSYDEYTRLTRPKTDLVAFLRESPLAETDIEISRQKDLPRDTEL